jgi:hypothetical protein
MSQKFQMFPAQASFGVWLYLNTVLLPASYGGILYHMEGGSPLSMASSRILPAGGRSSTLQVLRWGAVGTPGEEPAGGNPQSRRSGLGPESHVKARPTPCGDMHHTNRLLYKEVESAILEGGIFFNSFEDLAFHPLLFLIHHPLLFLIHHPLLWQTSSSSHHSCCYFHFPVFATVTIAGQPT